MKENSISFPTFVICLEREKQRRKRIEAHLNSKKIAFNFFNAIDGRLLSIEEREKKYSKDKAINVRGRPLAAGEIGCYLSHCAIWQRMIDEEIEQALILESDVVITPESIETLQGIETINSDWELIKLHYRACHPSIWKQKRINKTSKLVKFSNKNSSTTAYLVSKEGAKKLLAKAFPIHMPVDDYMSGKYINKGLNTYAAFPMPIRMTDDALDSSSIREDLFPLMDEIGIKRRKNKQTSSAKEIEKKIRQFFKKLLPPPWL